MAGTAEFAAFHDESPGKDVQGKLGRETDAFKPSPFVVRWFDGLTMRSSR
jgi:hypothetical protein